MSGNALPLPFGQLPAVDDPSFAAALQANFERLALVIGNTPTATTTLASLGIARGDATATNGTGVSAPATFTVNHGLTGTPQVDITPYDATVREFTVTARSSTQFSVAIGNVLPAGTIAFGWVAVL